jgi:hypothetical protein
MPEPHATAVKRFTVWAGEGSAFVEWRSQSKIIDWGEAFKKLEEPTFYYNRDKVVIMHNRLKELRKVFLKALLRS